MKDELRGQNNVRICWIKSKNLCCVIKRKLRFENQKNCLEAAHLENKINYREKNKINVYSFEKDNKKVLKTTAKI